MKEFSLGRGDTSEAEALPKHYDPAGTERRWQLAWEESNAFHPDPKSDGEPFSIVIPPPNVTGSLHMGHAFNTALIDTVVRYKRLIGKNVLCLPGTDHASIAVQTILEKQLREEGTTLDKLGRQEFLDRAWKWKDDSGDRIVGQLRRLGYSVDWERQRFTLDEGLNKAVVEAFIRLHKQGLIYRGEYLVNWCPASCSAVSDLEVEMKEVDGSLWYFKYPLTSSNLNLDIKFLTVATTRPETMLGDSAVAVNPLDDRYKSLIGQKLIIPFVNREIPIIGDEYVDQSFGTGCVKITPAHDPNDFEMGKRHNLQQITVMNKDGSMNKNAAEFQGLDRFEARKQIVESLKQKGLLDRVEPYKYTVPFSDRGKVPVEPLISTQWFVRTEPLAARCLAYQAKGEPNFIPERWQKVYLDWLTGIRDWCISRQLWWGHRIPAWFVVSLTNGEVTNSTPYVVAHSEKEALFEARKNYGEDVEIIQDNDVLDTWFSSGLWPFSTLGWPDQESDDFNCWYPTSTLITGFDIIFFWVARMTMLAGAFTGKMPFRDVYIHGLVRDEHNRKMSKSIGNGIDPILLIDLYGADALRFALVREVAGAGQDIRLDFDRSKQTSATVEASRNFANKLWNATRFVLLNFGSSIPKYPDQIDYSNLQLSDKWILSRLARVNIQTLERYESYSLGEAAKGLYEFAWNDFCDWYLELIKRRININKDATESELLDQKVAQQVLVKVLTDLYIMLNPLMPHLTEELWHALTGASQSTILANQNWPKTNNLFLNQELETSFIDLFSSIRLVRNLRSIAGFKPSQLIPIRYITNKSNFSKIIQSMRADISYLLRISDLEILDSKRANNKSSDRSLAGVIGDLEVVLPIEGLVDIESLRHRLEKDLEKANKEITVLSRRLDNKNFSEKAPSNIVNECKSKLADWQIQAELAQKRLADLL